MKVSTLGKKISSTCVPRDVTVLYMISMSGTDAGRGVNRPGARTLVFVLKRLTQSNASLLFLYVESRHTGSAPSTSGTHTGGV